MNIHGTITVVKNREDGNDVEETNILVVDDEKEIADLLEIYLISDGFQVLKAYSAKEGLRILEEKKIDLVLLDVMLPDMDGIAMCRRIRETNNIPIIMVSAKTQDIDKIVGLSTGADDYVAKPFNPLELMARVKSQLRRYRELNPSKPHERQEVISLKHLEINKVTHQVVCYGESIKLTPIEYNILLLLVKNQGKVFSIDQIYESIWNEDAIGVDNTVAVHIRHIREKIEINPKEPRYLKVVWGVGYKIEKL
mgnify:CR=1 FL=1